MKPKILNDITNIFAKLSGSKDYDPRVKYDTALEYYANQVPVVPNPGSGDSGKAIVAGTDNKYKLENVELEKLVVNITEDNSNHYVADKTLAELNAAYSAGKKIEFHYFTYVLPVVYYQNNNYQATIASISDTGAPAGVISIFYNAFGIYLVVDGPFERAIHVTLHPDTMQFSFMSIEALNAVQSGTPFKLSVAIDGNTRYLLCQLNSSVPTNRYKATLIDGHVIYAAQVEFNGATATIFNYDGNNVYNIEDLRQISVAPCASYDGNNSVFWGYDSYGYLSFNVVPNFTLCDISDSAFASQLVTIIGGLKTAAMSASDKKASGYVYAGDGAILYLMDTVRLLSQNRQVILRLGRYFFIVDGVVFDSGGEDTEAVTYKAMDIDSPATVGTDPAVTYKIRLTVTNAGLAVIEVEANAVPALPIQP